MDGEIQFMHTADVGGTGVKLMVSAFLTVSGGTAPSLRTTMAAVKTFLGTYFVDKKGQYSYLGPLYQMDVKPSFWFSISELAEDLFGSGANYANYYTCAPGPSRAVCVYGRNAHVCSWQQACVCERAVQELQSAEQGLVLAPL
eukprot:2859325-Rhodomonas_salina.1